MAFSRRKCPEEGKDFLFCRSGDRQQFLELRRCDLPQVPERGQNCHKAVLDSTMPNYCANSTTIYRKNVQFSEENVLFQHENASAHTTALASTIWSNRAAGCCLIHYIRRNRPVRLSFVPMVRKAFAGRNLCRVMSSLLPRRRTLQALRKIRSSPVKEVETMLGQVYQTKCRLLRNNLRRFQNLRFLLYPNYLSDYLRIVCNGCHGVQKLAPGSNVALKKPPIVVKAVVYVGIHGLSKVIQTSIILI